MKRRGTMGFGFVLFVVIVYVALAYVGLAPWVFG